MTQEKLEASKGGSRYRIWLEQASFDIKAAQISFEKGYYEWACYQSTQSFEKCLKAVIVQAGWRPPRIHKFSILIGMANQANRYFLDIKLNFRKLEAYTFVSRYPFIIPGQDKSPHDFITKQDALTCIAVAQDMFGKIKDFLERNKVKKNTKTVIDIEDNYFDADEIQTRINRVVGEISRCEKMNVEKIILYGSFAREKIRPRTSTMDLLIVAETDLNFIDRMEYIRELTSGGEPTIEPLVYTPEEFDYMLKDQAEGYLESAIEEGVVIYQK